MKILVTGGAGFIGSHVVDALVDRGYEVVVLDNLSSGKRENINERAEFIQVDITNLDEVKDIVSNEKPDVMYHFAAQISVRNSIEDPTYDIQTNILASANLIKCSHESGVKKFIFASTGGVTYGDSAVRPTPESFSEDPLSPYVISKTTVDRFLEYYNKVHELKFTSLRYANVYGPRQNPHGEAGVIAIFTEKLLRGEIPIIYGTGENTRDYVYVSDIVQVNILAMENINSVGIYNIGTGIEASVNDLFQSLNTLLGKSIAPKCSELTSQEQQRSSLDASKAQKELGWLPQVNLKDGLQKTIQWYKSKQK